jgi:hypothetical protein
MAATGRSDPWRGAARTFCGVTPAASAPGKGAAVARGCAGFFVWRRLEAGSVGARFLVVTAFGARLRFDAANVGGWV